MTTKSNANFLTGLITGAVAALILVIVIQYLKAPASASHGDLLAEADGLKLTRTEVSKKLASRLVPIENEEYDLFAREINAWLEEKLIEKEARANNTDPKELYSKEVWAKIQITPQAILDAYQRNAEALGNIGVDKAAPFLTQKLSQIEFDRLNQILFNRLKEKYKAKIYLEKPASYYDGFVPPARPMPGTPQQDTPQPAAAGLPPATASFDDLAGRPSAGPENAPVTIVEFSDFHCPFCKKIEPTIDQLMKNYPGKIRKVWRHFPLPFHTGADRTHEASECAHAQGKFWEFHQKLFENVGGFKDDASLIQLAEQTGLDKAKFEGCLTSNRNKAVVQKDIQKGSASGVDGTPAVFLNGRLISGAQPYPNFANMVEALLDPAKAAQFAAPQAARPAPAAPPAPTNVTFTDLEGRPSVGPKDAAITLVEFSDFFCPFCQRVEPTIAQLMKNYEGKIRKVWRHFPLPFHTGADRAHEASECAHEQGKFWAYHDKLFQNVGAAKDDAALIKLAEEAKLNGKKFKSCLTSGKYKELVQKEIARGAEAGVQGTPAVFVNGELVSGARPYESFDAIIKKKLAA